MNEIKLRSVEIYPNIVQPFSVQDNQHLRDAYIKGAEEWYNKGKEEGLSAMAGFAIDLGYEFENLDSSSELLELYRKSINQ